MKEVDSKIIFNYLSGKCRKEELEHINLWMEESERNKKWLFEMKALWDMEQFKNYDNEDYLDVQFRKTWNRIKGLSRKRQERNRRLVTIVGYVAAACLLGIIIGYGLLKSSADKKLQYIVERVTSSDSIRRITLPDRSVVWLNANSQIKYLPQLGKDERRVLLTGEACFEVTPDINRPFRVETPDFTVKVLGTTFNVAAYTGNNNSETTLISGKVAIENSRREELLVLHPGQKATYSKATQKMTVKDADIEAETAWKNAFISFERSEIKEIIEKLEYVYGEQITLQLMPDTHSSKTYSGAVARGDSLENVLKNLQNVIPFHFEKRYGGFIISMKTK